MREWNNILNKELEEKEEEINNKNEQINIIKNDN